MTRLGVNIDHIATLRQQRKGKIPDLIEAARVCERAGADGITVHLREDRRHIQDRDVFLLKKTISTKLNLEMAASEEIIRIALKLKPDDACIVPERRRELTTEGGLDVTSERKKLTKVVQRLKKAGIKVSMFIAPHIRQVLASKEIGADCVELHTGRYTEAKSKRERAKELRKLRQASSFAGKIGLEIHAGHGLDYDNVKPVAGLAGMKELNIGYSIVCDSVFTGLRSAVSKMKKLIKC